MAKRKASETGGRWTKGREKNLNELNAVRAFQEINKALSLMGDSPEEKAAIERNTRLKEQGKFLEADNISPEEAERIGQSFMKDQRFGNYAQSERDRTKRINESFVPDRAKPQAGNLLNIAAMDKIEYEKGRGGMSGQPPTIIDASTVQNVSNNTLIRPPSPSGQFLPGERRDFG